MRTRRKRLKIKTVIHRARQYVNDGDKTGAINSILRDTDYSPMEAQTLVEFIENFFDVQPDFYIVDRWCDRHRISRFVCKSRHGQEVEEPTPTSAAAVPTAPVRRSNCACGDAACNNEWHHLAMWIGENPREWHRLLEGLE